MPGDVTIDVRGAVAKLERLHVGIYQAGQLALEAAMAAAEQSAKGTTLFKDRSGTTRGSVRAELTGPMRGFVEAGGVARLLENGTPPHEIVARRALMLRFVVNGHVVFRRMVHHPGTAERPFMRIAREEAQKVADYAAEFYVDFAMRRV